MRTIRDGYLIKKSNGTYDSPTSDKFWGHKGNAEFALDARRTYDPKGYEGAEVVQVFLMEV